MTNTLEPCKGGSLNLKNLNTHIFGMECVTDLIPVSFCSLKCQLPSDTKYFNFIPCKNDGNLQSCGFRHIIDL